MDGVLVTGTKRGRGWVDGTINPDGPHLFLLHMVYVCRTGLKSSLVSRVIYTLIPDESTP